VSFSVFPSDITFNDRIGSFLPAMLTTLHIRTLAGLGPLVQESTPLHHTHEICF